LQQFIRHITSMDKKSDLNNAPKGVVTTYPVPPEGSLGLLALGWRGLMQWRAARVAAEQQNNKTNEQKG
jgi:hypothetical protein